MKKVTEETSAGKSEARPSGLDDLIQQGARQIIQQAIEAELTTLLERYDNVKTRREAGRDSQWLPAGARGRHGNRSNLVYTD